MWSQQTSQQDFLNAAGQAEWQIYMEELLYKNSPDNFYKKEKEEVALSESRTNEKKQVMAQKLMQ